MEPQISRAARIGRRALIAGAAGGLAAAGARAALSGDWVSAAVDDPIKLGESNEADATTKVYRPAASNYTQAVYLNSLTAAVEGDDYRVGGFGVYGLAVGLNGTGVYGDASESGNSGVAVHGRQVPTGIGVKGTTTNGVALYGEATGGYGLEVSGRAVFSRSGKVHVAQGKNTVSVIRNGAKNYLGPATLIVATIQGHVAGTWVTGVKINTPQEFTIFLNKPAPTSVGVGFFIVN